jgi:protein-L-isoaspartate(D-aspartate) O-methyltransferase
MLVPVKRRQWVRVRGAGIGCVLLAVVAAAWSSEPAGIPVQRLQAARERMIRQDIEGRGIRDAAVLKAMDAVPREQFVPLELLGEAYADRPLPIGHGQTISQPYIVAAMSEMLRVGPDSKVLEIGTGSGYQAAILAVYVRDVYTIEIIEPLAREAETRLAGLGYTNVHVQVEDGYYGWPEEAPFDAIIVTAAASHIPPPLIEQLRPGGRMAIPVGAPLQVQYLLLVEKRDNGTIIQRNVMPVRFVPLTGDRR